MEKLNDILKTIIGILLVVSFVAAFSSCNSEGDKRVNTEEQLAQDTVRENEEDKSSFKEKLKKESIELEADLDTLERKVKEKGGKVSEEVQAELKELNEERKRILNDSTDEDIERRWEEFKIKARREMDSLDREI